MKDKHHDSSQRRSKLDAKKNAVLGASQTSSAPKSRKFILLGCVLVVAFTALFLVFSHSGPKDKVVAAAAPVQVVPVEGELIHAASMFADGQARHFVLETADGVGIRYFVLQTADGRVRTAFDACDACWRENMGYVQEGDVMICRNCNMRFPTRVIGEVRGGCNPTPLTAFLRDGSLVIRESDVLEGRTYFDLGAGSASG
ncbi:Fe-S-containing protein [Desulfonatronum parangueonense]